MDIVILILISTLHCRPAVTISTHHVRAVAPHDYYRNAPLPPDKTNWEIGLKEATYQALLREQNTDPHLKQQIYASSIEGYQDSATPFGDIAVIARGQLYSNVHGYQFIQDPYQNDCDDCHTAHHRCERGQCEPQAAQNIDDLLALWTVKRIRHRDAKFGHRYELQYTISPMNPAANARFVTRNGRFDYSIPGHVFIVKLKEDGAESRLENIRTNFRFDKEHRSTNYKELKTTWIHNHRQVGSNDEEIVHHKTQNHYHNTPNSILLNTGEYYLAHKPKPTESDQGFNSGFLIGISPNGYKHVVHDLPNIAPNNGPYIDSKPFVPSHQEPPTTKEPVKHYHHHFYIPEVEDIDYDDHKIVRPVVPTASTKEPHQFVTGFRPTIPHKFILTTMHQQQQNGADTTPKRVYTPETTQVVPPLTTYSTYKYPETTVPIAISPTIFTEPNYVENPTYPRTTLLKVFTVPVTHPTQPTPFSPSPFYVQYSDPDPTYNNNQPPTVPTFVTQTIQTTGQPTYYTVQEETVEPKTKTLVGIFEEIPTTEATTSTPVITTKKMKYHNSINSQLPPPEKGSDTTVPYVASTAVTILSTSSRNDDENEAESSDRKSTTIQDTIQTTTATSVNESTETEPMINSIFTTKFEAQSTVFPTQSDETTTLTASTDNLITTTTLATTLQTENRKDSSGEDIFGTVSIPRKSKPKVVYSDEFDIFGGSKKPKDTTTESLKRSETVSTSKRPNAYDEIFGEFKSSTAKTKLLTPHTSLTVSPESALRNARISKYLKYKRNKSDRLSKFRPNKEAENTTEQTDTNVTDVRASERNDIETKTSQSLITSISFKVNKNKYGGAQLSSTQASNVVQEDETKEVPKGDMIEVNRNDTDFKVYKANLRDSIKTTTDQSQTFDDIAQTLVNHARVANFLNGKITKPTKRTYRPSLR